MGEDHSDDHAEAGVLPPHAAGELSLSLSLFHSLSVYLSVYLSECLSVCLYVSMSVSVCVCVCVSLSLSHSEGGGTDHSDDHAEAGVLPPHAAGELARPLLELRRLRPHRVRLQRERVSDMFIFIDTYRLIYM